MRCPLCLVKMTKDEYYICPKCGGEFFPVEYLRRQEDPAYMATWEWSMQTYYKAMRDSYAIDRCMVKHGYGRILQGSRYCWEKFMKM